MPEISRFLGIIITMVYDDHNPPHFHAKYGAFFASIDIEKLTISAGSLPPRVLGLVLEWATIHNEDLLADWQLMVKNLPLKKIEPLV